MKKPPCPPKCPKRRPACQGSCPDYKKYRAALDEENRKIREAKEEAKDWTAASQKSYKQYQGGQK